MSTKPSFLPGKAGIATGVPQLRIDWHTPLNERLVLPNGVYVPVGERPDHGTLQSIGRAFGSMQFAERKIPTDQTTDGVLLGEMMDYGISPVTPKDINSEHVNNCHMLVAMGIAKSGATPLEENAVLAHINPAAHMLKSRNFHQRLRERVEALRDATHSFTRDVLFAGGCIDTSSEQRADWSTQLCIHSIQTLESICANLDVEPTVTRPGIQDLDTHMALATQRRTLIVRPSLAPQTEFPEQFVPSLFLASEAKKYIERMRNAMQWQ
jgi:hypothetical protein